MRRPARLAAGVLALVLATNLACAGGEARMSPATSALLQEHVLAVRQAAVAGDRAAAEQRLGALRTLVAELSGQGELTGPAAQAVLAAAAEVEAALTLLPTTTIAAPPPHRGDEDGDGNAGRGNAGRDGRDDDDDEDDDDG
jgi:hypothetical protein